MVSHRTRSPLAHVGPTERRGHRRQRLL